MASEFKPSSLDFGVVVAFVAPGFIVLRGLAYLIPAAADLTTTAADKDQGVGAFLYVLLASLSLGLAVSGIRDLLVDVPLHLKFGKDKRQLVPDLALDWKKIDERNLAVLITIRDNFYRYYQFYANTAVAMVLWVVAYYRSREPELPVVADGVILAGIVLLLWAAKRALGRYVEAVGQLLK